MLASGPVVSATRAALRSLAALLAASALAGCAAHGAPRRRERNAGGERPVAVQLHVHGHSHHNSPEKPGSMSWHSDFAKAAGYDVLWWSDHTNFLDQRNGFYLQLHAAAIDTATFGILFPRRGRNEVGYMEPIVTGGRAKAGLSDGRLTIALTSRGRDAFDRMSYRLCESERGRRRVRGFDLARPLYCEPSLLLRAELGASGPDASAVIELPLSWHRFDGRSIQQSLVFRLRRGAGPPRAAVRGRHSVEVDLFVGPGEQAIEIPLLRYARLLPEGDDNTTTDIRLGVEARCGGTARATFWDVALVSRRPQPDSAWASLRGLAARGARQWGLEEYLGGESNRTAVHMNAFLADDSTAFAALWPIPPYAGFSDSLVARVHAAGGLVSFNHMFGTRTSDALPADDDQTKRAAALAESLLAVRVYGADLLEVGYLRRGGADLPHHLWVWDYLNARGLFINGTGVSDSHGNEYDASMPNPFVTWVWSRGTDRPRLIAGLRDGRATFGNPLAFHGSLDFTVDGTPMGGVRVCESDSALLRVEARGIDDVRGGAGVEVRLVQAAIEPDGATLRYVERRMLADTAQPVVLDTRRPSLVRLEAWRGSEPLAFTNPVRLLKPDR